MTHGAVVSSDILFIGELLQNGLGENLPSDKGL